MTVTQQAYPIDTQRLRVVRRLYMYPSFSCGITLRKPVVQRPFRISSTSPPDMASYDSQEMIFYTGLAMLPVDEQRGTWGLLLGDISLADMAKVAIAVEDPQNGYSDETKGKVNLCHRLALSIQLERTIAQGIADKEAAFLREAEIVKAAKLREAERDLAASLREAANVEAAKLREAEIEKRARERQEASDAAGSVQFANLQTALNELLRGRSKPLRATAMAEPSTRAMPEPPKVGQPKPQGAESAPRRFLSQHGFQSGINLKNFPEKEIEAEAPKVFDLELMEKNDERVKASNKAHAEQSKAKKASFDAALEAKQAAKVQVADLLFIRNARTHHG